MSYLYELDIDTYGVPAPTTRVYRASGRRVAREVIAEVSISDELPESSSWSILARLEAIGWVGRTDEIAKEHITTLAALVRTGRGAKRFASARGQLWAEMWAAGWSHRQLGKLFGRPQTTVTYSIDQWLNRQPRSVRAA